MRSFRPHSDGRYLERRRLLARLPDSAGYVVWLEAPYGYGKSVLAAQWAEEVEAEGWRVVWLTVAEVGVRGALTDWAGLPHDAPWEVVLEEVWREPTLLVLEEVESLEASAELSALLKRPQGLLLLASRSEVASPELLRLLTTGRLLHLDARALAFDLAETAALFGDAKKAAEVWQQTQGWPLPTHFAALTGEMPRRRALIEGVRSSLAETEWEEALLLAALPYLPPEAGVVVTEGLARSGFAQVLERGIRLHPMVADALLGAYGDEVRRAVERGAERLEPLLRGMAFERVGLTEALAALLETTDAALARRAPGLVLRWDALAPRRPSAARGRLVGWSRCALGEYERGIETLLASAALPDLSPTELLACYRDAIWFLGQARDFERAQRLEHAARDLIAQSDPEVAGAYLNNLFIIHFERGAWDEAEATLRRALELYPADSPKRAISQGNVAIVRWHRDGDIDTLRMERGKALESNKRHNPSNVPGDLLQLGEVAWLLGERERALAYCREAQLYAAAAPRWALEAEALGAYLEGDDRRFPALLARAEAWREAALIDRVRYFWARTLLETGKGGALALLGEHQGFWSATARALALAAEPERALAALGERPSPQRFMEERLAWQAARYRITRDLRDLDDLLDLSVARERVLPGLVPLAELPPERPELSQSYPLAELLRSGFKAAIALRLKEIPPLELTLLGRVELRHLGVLRTLSGRHQELVTLLALRQPRERIAEALWPESDVDKSRNNLNVLFTLLRKVIEPWGVPTYLGEAGLVRSDVDLWHLEQALAAGRAAEVVTLYQPPLAPGVDLPLVDEARAALAKRVGEVLLAGAARAAPEVAEGYLERLLQLEPLNEEVLQRLLELLTARGKRHKAQLLYHEFRRKLKEELGLEPLPATRALLEP